MNVPLWWCSRFDRLFVLHPKRWYDWNLPSKSSVLHFSYFLIQQRLAVCCMGSRCILQGCDAWRVIFLGGNQGADYPDRWRDLWDNPVRPRHHGMPVQWVLGRKLLFQCWSIPFIFCASVWNSRAYSSTRLQLCLTVIRHSQTFLNTIELPTKQGNKVFIGGNRLTTFLPFDCSPGKPFQLAG